MHWIKDNRWSTKVYYQLNTFDKYTYKFEVVIEGDKAFVALSSGRKRKSLDIFEEKTEKSLAGLSPLFWARDCIKEIHELFKEDFYIIIGWSDSRRRDIYFRFLPDFKESRFENKKILIKACDIKK